MSDPAPTTPQGEGPFVPDDVVLPEFTWKAVLLGVALAVLLGAANAYVGLKVGLTVSASIPAAVISMGVLRFFKTNNILENNIVQTIASAGESLAAGIIFTVPALIFMGIWHEVHILETFLIAILGGTLGVLFTIPLRRALVVEEDLPFPEGVACSHVLKAGQQASGGVRFLLGGLLVGALFNLGSLGLRLWGDTLEGARRVGDAIAYAGVSLSPILLAVGYIVGPRIGAVVFAGSALAWFVIIPLLMTGIPGVWAGYGYPAGQTALNAGYLFWNQYVRLVGGGAMITGGLHALWRARSSLRKALGQGISGASRNLTGDDVPRTERDVDIRKVVLLSAALMVPIFGLYWSFTGDVVQALGAAVFLAVAGFFFSAVAGYMAGVVGSSNNPISGVTIVTLIFSSLLLLALGATGTQGVLGALGVGAVIACAGAIAADNLHDLKTGHLVGATPWKQQVALILGVGTFAVVAAPTLALLQRVFGIGSAQLPAPQAGLMSIILQGIFHIGGANLNWTLVILGALLGLVLVLLRVPVMAAAVGIYLPFPLTLPILLGGLLRLAVERLAYPRLPVAANGLVDEEERGRVERHGLLFSSGIIAGDAIVGILLAFLFLFEPTGSSRLVTGLIAPTLVGGLVAVGVLLLGRGLGRWRVPAAILVVLAGLGGSAWAILADLQYTFVDASPWPGFLLLVYIAVLMVYLPVRHLLVRSDEVEGLEPGPEDAA